MFQFRKRRPGAAPREPSGDISADGASALWAGPHTGECGLVSRERLLAAGPTVTPSAR